MAKPKSPKKTNDVNQTTPVQNASPASPLASGADNVTQATAPASPSAPAAKAQPKKTGKKPEIMRSEPRANLVPINMEDEIRRLAYLLSERRGFEPGHETEDWLAAEHEVLQRYRQHSAQSA